MSKTVLLTAGGTGGHLFPAQALASELSRRGWTVELATDERADKYGTEFPARKVHIIASATIRGRNPIALTKTAFQLLFGTLQARKVIKALQPDVVAGFGGYPTFPPMYAARLTNTPSILHEANAVMGRANKLLAKGVSAIATSVPIEGLPADLSGKLVETGNPVRDAVIDASELSYTPPREGGELNLLVLAVPKGRAFSPISYRQHLRNCRKMFGLDYALSSNAVQKTWTGSKKHSMNLG